MCTQTLTHKHTQTHMYDARVCVYISSIGRKTYTRAYTCVCVCVYICYNIPDSKVWASSRSRETMALRWCLSAFSLKGRNSGKVRAIVYFLCEVAIHRILFFRMPPPLKLSCFCEHACTPVFTLYTHTHTHTHTHTAEMSVPSTFNIESHCIVYRGLLRICYRRLPRRPRSETQESFSLSLSLS